MASSRPITAQLAGDSGERAHGASAVRTSGLGMEARMPLARSMATPAAMSTSPMLNTFEKTGQAARHRHDVAEHEEVRALAGDHRVVVDVGPSVATPATSRARVEAGM